MSKKNKLKFHCIENCGACCKTAGRTGLVPTKPNSDECLHLGEDLKCKIYDHRPTFCSVTSMWRFKYKPTGVTRVEYYKMSNKQCNILMDEVGLPEEMRIDVAKVYGKGAK